MFSPRQFATDDRSATRISFRAMHYMLISFLALSSCSIITITNVDAFFSSCYYQYSHNVNHRTTTSQSTPSTTYSTHRRSDIPLLSPTIFGKKPDSNSETTKDRDKEVTSLWTKEQLGDYANEQGIVISLTTLGPAYRAIARAKHNTTQVLGYIEGFVRPGNQILHLDKMQVFKKMVRLARKENPNEFRGGGTPLGIGLLLGYICLLHGQSVGCTTAEFLAIDDEAYQHKRLVKYYKQGGFDIIKYVGDDWKSIPDRLMWGGCGTLLRKDIPYLLQFWTSILEKSVRYEKSRNDDYIKLMQQKR